MKKYILFLLFTFLFCHLGYGQKTYDLRYNDFKVLDGGVETDTVMVGQDYILSGSIYNNGPQSFDGSIILNVAIDPIHTDYPFFNSDITFKLEELDFSKNPILALSVSHFQVPFKVTKANFPKSDTTVIVITWPNDGVTAGDSEPSNDYNIFKIFVKSDPNDINASIKTIGNPIKMNLYPNPATNVVQVSYSGLEENSILDITDVSGKIILSKNLRANVGKQTAEINLSEKDNPLATGVYFVKITNRNQQTFTKLLITR